MLGCARGKTEVLEGDWKPKPSGVVHIGNYFGMMRPAIELQAEGEAFYFIADYHALTSVRDPKALRENSRPIALDFLASGLDPERGALFRQSDVPQVTELACILSTVAPVGLLERDDAMAFRQQAIRQIATLKKSGCTGHDGNGIFCANWHCSFI